MSLRYNIFLICAFVLGFVGYGLMVYSISWTAVFTWKWTNPDLILNENQFIISILMQIPLLFTWLREVEESNT